MESLNNIVKSWLSSFNPSEDEKKVALNRLNICNECEEKRINSVLKYHYCGLCLCPLKSKIYSPIDNSQKCPLNKWKI